MELYADLMYLLKHVVVSVVTSVIIEILKR